MIETEFTLFWFRRDLRLHDNTGLSAALERGRPVLPIFIFDREILKNLKDKNDARVDFIHATLQQLDAEFKKIGTRLNVFYGKPIDVFQKILKSHSIRDVYTNHDYEPYAHERDDSIAKFLSSRGAEFKTFKDQVIFEKADIRKKDGTPYTVFTPFGKQWKKLYDEQELTIQKSAPFQTKNFYSHQAPLEPFPSLKELGFEKSPLEIPYLKSQTRKFPEAIVKTYEKTRNIPSVRGTSRLGLHLRFGTVSVRELARLARKTNDTFLNELIWREFFMQILYHFPKVVDQPFKPKYAGIRWRHSRKDFEAWCQGQTGYPLVDAGMRELNQTGFMHNRVRMVTASFLVKHLLLGPKWGEAYFARKLLDFDLAANNGNWQWVAGTGCDAAPYFRVFNPELQLKKFDPDYKYVKQWIPEYGSARYPSPIVGHELARERVLAAYRLALAHP